MQTRAVGTVECERVTRFAGASCVGFRPRTMRGGVLGALGSGAREGACPTGIRALRTGGVSGTRPGVLAADPIRRIDRPRGAHAGRFSNVSVALVMSADEKKLTAYHEGGHAIVGRLVPEHDPVYKVTIIPRGRALGVTMFLPEEDRLSYSKERLESQISSLFGGRIAEELVFGPEAVTTGASNDIERVTEIARNMVTKWGLSEKLGPMTYSDDDGEIFLGHSVTQHKTVSDETAHVIDEEVRIIVERNYARAKTILDSNLDKLHLMAEALLKYETLDTAQIDDIMEGRPPRPPDDWMDDDQRRADSANSSDASTDEPDPKDGTIGGPASLH